jgi:hypothetical protein
MTSTYEDRTLLTTDVAIKGPVRATTTANLVLNGLQTIDGIALAANDRVLVKNQASGADNGIYLASTGSWTRASDFQGNRAAVDGTLVLVRLGTANALSIYELSCSTSPANIGTTSLTFNLVSVIIGGAGSYTTLTASGQITSSLATGTAPLVIASTTKVANLNVDLLDGTDWSAPGAIGGGTPGAGTFTTIVATATGKVATTLGVGNATPSASGAGVSFPATAAPSTDPNTMDDYEEGTWVPTLGGTATYSVQTGTYVKIGKLVFINGQIAVTAIGTGSTIGISGLPFTSFNDGSSVDAAIAVVQSASLATAVVSITGLIGTSATSILFKSRTAANAADASNALFQASATLAFSGCYLAA